MGKINGANIKKAFYYLKRNGAVNAFHAAKERLSRREDDYCYCTPGEDLLEEQREKAKDCSVAFSIVVPAYGTGEAYLRAMIASVRKQSYPKWELIVADATEDDSVERVAASYDDSRIRYVRLEKNLGIAENTNQGLTHVRYEYTGLLDHDDVLTGDALFEMARQIEDRKKCGIDVKMLYSDEDKCNSDASRYYEPNRKEKFNLDLLLSNNYICHFLVMKSDLLKELGFRKEYDGAQDFDLVLRAAEKILWQDKSRADETKGREERQTGGSPEAAEKSIVHIPKVLYHWRCHEESTAANPQSKAYAYRAGRRAVQDFADRRGWKAEARDLKHLGFYELDYGGRLLEQRSDIGAVGGKLLSGGKIAGGRYETDGSLMYEGLPQSYSGYMNRAVLQQEAAAVDIRVIQVRAECRELFEEITGVPYKTLPGEETLDASVLPKDMDYRAVSIALGKAIRESGYRVLWLPSWVERWEKN